MAELPIYEILLNCKAFYAGGKALKAKNSRQRPFAPAVYQEG